MKTFTPSTFRADSASVYNYVMLNGMARIDHRNRPAMILITEDKLNELKKAAKQEKSEAV